MSRELAWPDVPVGRKLCASCLETEPTAPDGLCDDCAADAEADRDWEARQERAREQADLDEAEARRDDAWKDRDECP
jgi:hypothetical protein